MLLDLLHFWTSLPSPHPNVNKKYIQHWYKCVQVHLLETVTMNAQSAVLPLLSLNTYRTSVPPVENTSPGWCVCSCVATVPDSSVAVGSVQVAVAMLWPNGAETLIGPGQLLTTGGVLSTTVRIEWCDLCTWEKDFGFMLSRFFSSDSCHHSDLLVM